jgi:hypothetical protein
MAATAALDRAGMQDILDKGHSRVLCRYWGEADDVLKEKAAVAAVEPLLFEPGGPVPVEVRAVQYGSAPCTRVQPTDSATLSVAFGDIKYRGTNHLRS